MPPPPFKLTCTTSSQLPAWPMEAASAASCPLPLAVVPECTSRATSPAAVPLLLLAGLAGAGLGGDLGLEAGEAAGLGCRQVQYWRPWWE